MKKTYKERYEEAAPGFRALLKSILLALKQQLRNMLGLKPDPNIPKRKRPRIGKDPTPRKRKKRRGVRQ
jgi:hypothetical protein